MKIITTILFLLFSITIFGGKFPLRAKYPNLKPISTEELKKEYKSINIVDARSSVEYKVIHINKSVLISVSKKSFEKLLQKKFSDKNSKIAFYCNGHTCAKSYKAAKRAKKLGYINLFVYDAGIFEWTKANPNLSTLLGKSPAKSSKLIDKDSFTAKLLNFKDFKSKLKEKNTIVFDIRESYQKFNPNKTSQKYRLPIKAKVRSIPFDKIIKNFINKKREQDKTLLFYDATGKQVRWLQYYLKKEGYKNYFFLKGGVKQFYK